MKLYVIKTTPDIGLCSIGPVCSPDGELFGGWDGPSPFDVDHGVAEVDRALALGDRLVSIDADLVVSETAKKVIETLAPADHLSFLRTKVLSPRGKLMGEYYFALHHAEVDALDYDRSEFNYFHGEPKMIRDVKKWGFNEGKLPGFDIFRSKYRYWIGTEEARRAIKEAQLTGFDFDLVWDSNG